MSSDVKLCVMGCSRRNADGQREAVQTRSAAQLCQRCVGRLDGWLERIPDLYARLPGVLLPGSVEASENKRTKAPDAPVPLRLGVVDLLDERLARMRGGWLPKADGSRRGVLGVLMELAGEVREERGLTQPSTHTVAGECALLRAHLSWLVEQDRAADVLVDVKGVYRELADACGEYRAKPVGRCVVELGEEQPMPCGGPLMSSKYGGVRCSRCGDTWNAADLRRLGLLLAEQQLEGESA